MGAGLVYSSDSSLDELRGLYTNLVEDLIHTAPDREMYLPRAQSLSNPKINTISGLFWRRRLKAVT
jgi:hypothetical protein